MEFYLLNYFKPAVYQRTHFTEKGRQPMEIFRCTSCHIPELVVAVDRRVADVETVYDRQHGHFNGLFATAEPRLIEVNDGSGHLTPEAAGGGLVRRFQLLRRLRAPRSWPQFPEDDL